MTAGLALAIFIAASMFAIFGFVAVRYKRSTPDRALVVFGRLPDGLSAKVYQGGGALVMPVIQGHGWLAMGPVELRSTVTGVDTGQGMRVDAEARMTAGITKHPDGMQQAAQYLLDRPEDEIATLVEPILAEALREAVVQSGGAHGEAARTAVAQALVPAVSSTIAPLGLEVVIAQVERVEPSHHRQAQTIALALHEAIEETAPPPGSPELRALRQTLDGIAASAEPAPGDAQQLRSSTAALREWRGSAAD